MVDTRNPKRPPGFISELGVLLQDLQQTHPKSQSQQAEQQKFARIIDLRDNTQPPPDPNQLWDKF